MPNIIQLPPNAVLLHDNELWCNRFEIPSETSRRCYVVSQNIDKRHWACSCPGWKTRRKCKHLDQVGVPGNEVPFEAIIDSERLITPATPLRRVAQPKLKKPGRAFSLQEE